MPVQQKTMEYNTIWRETFYKKKKKNVFFPSTEGKNYCDTSWIEDKGFLTKS